MMKKSLLYFCTLFYFIFNCQIKPPCSVLDSTCNPLGYFIPNLIRPNQVAPTGTGTGTSSGTATPTFPIQANGGPNLISLSWAAQTGATSYRIYRKTTTGVTSSDTEITSGGTTALTFTDNNLTTARFYRVSYISSGQEILSTEVSATPVSSGLGLFLRADSINQVDNTAVPQWNDESGNNYHVTQGTPANQPIFRTNIINGRPVVRFIRANSHLLRRLTPNANLSNGTTNYNHTNFFVL